VAACFFRPVAEQALRGRAERFDAAPLVDDDHGVGHGLQDGPQARFRRLERKRDRRFAHRGIRLIGASP